MISVFIRERTICEDFAPKRTIVEGRKVVRLINVFAVLNGIISAEDIPSIARDHVFIRKHAKEIPFQRRCHRSEEHTSELQSLMRTSYAVFCLKKKNKKNITCNSTHKYHKI